MSESAFKHRIKQRIRELLPGCFMHEMKAGAQGIPDTLIIFKDHWAFLEFKRSADAPHRPNQDYYINLFNTMGFASFIFPQNKDEVLQRLVLYFKGNDCIEEEL